MMPDYFINDEPKELLSEVGIKFGVFGEFAQASNLPFLAAGVGGGQAVLGLVTANGLRDLEPLSEHENERGIDIIDAVTILVQLHIGHAGLPWLHLP
jgi:octaprenyl-diphosphate synthase